MVFNSLEILKSNFHNWVGFLSFAFVDDLLLKLSQRRLKVGLTSYMRELKQRQRQRERHLKI